MVSSGQTVASSDVNLAQQRNVGTSTLGTSNLTTTSAATELTSGTDTITVSVTAGRKYRIGYVFHYVGTVVGDGFNVKIKEGSASGGTQLTYVTADITTTGAVLTRTVWTEWTASSTGSVTFSTSVQRATGTGTCTGRGATSQPRILSVEWLGANA